MENKKFAHINKSDNIYSVIGYAESRTAMSTVPLELVVGNTIEEKFINLEKMFNSTIGYKDYDYVFLEFKNDKYTVSGFSRTDENIKGAVTLTLTQNIKNELKYKTIQECIEFLQNKFN